MLLCTLLTSVTWELHCAKARCRAPEFLTLRPTDDQPPLTNKLSIVVLPFTNASRDSEQKYFAAGMVRRSLPPRGAIYAQLHTIIMHTIVFADESQVRNSLHADSSGSQA